MMSKKYQKKTSRSRRKLQKLDQNAVKVDIADGQAKFQMILPMNALMAEVAGCIEQMSSQAGLLMMKAMIDEEVEQLAGQRYTHNACRQAFRWGSEEGSVIFAGRKVALERPRIRSKDGQEMPLRRYQAFQDDRRMQQAVQDRVVRRVSMRDYEGVIDDICDGYGIDKSSVSRQWKAASAAQLQQMLERRLDDLGLSVLMLDGINFHDYVLVVALGIDSDGSKHVLGLWPGATENAEVVSMLLDDLTGRGLPTDSNLLLVLDGSKSLTKAVKKRFGKRAVIQRCRIHKERNILGHLPKNYHKIVRMKLQTAWNMTDYQQAKEQLQKVHDYLATINLAAAHSLEEGFEETLMINRLKLPGNLRRLFGSTNIIESCFSVTKDLCRNVKRWRNADMAWRWAGTMLGQAERRFHRIMGYRDMPLLTKALGAMVDSKEVAA
jgi:transposase-like protein